MKKTLGLMLMLLASFGLIACNNQADPSDDNDTEMGIYSLLIEAEDLSGMKDRMQSVIREDGNLNWPTSYKGVTITYDSRNKDIIDDEGNVTRPDTCWIESRDQQGEDAFPGLNDNWPVVVDVTLSYMGQTRTAKLLFVVAPAPGFSCDKYLG